MEKRKSENKKSDNKKAEVKSIKLDQIKSLSSIDIDLKNLQKLADKFDKKGLSAYVPLSNKLLTIYDEMKVVASKSKLDVNEFFTTLGNNLISEGVAPAGSITSSVDLSLKIFFMSIRR